MILREEDDGGRVMVMSDDEKYWLTIYGASNYSQHVDYHHLSPVSTTSTTRVDGQS